MTATVRKGGIDTGAVVTKLNLRDKRSSLEKFLLFCQYRIPWEGEGEEREEEGGQEEEREEEKGDELTR